MMRVLRRARDSSVAAAILLLLISCEVRSQVPGEVYTESGYDNVNGTDPICWSAPGFQNSSTNNGQEESGTTTTDDHHLADFNGVNWHSDLEPDFVAGPTTMQSSCWNGTSVYIDILPEQVYGSDRLRTNRYYTYHILARIDLNAIRQDYPVSDNAFFYSSDGLHDVGLRIEFCPVNGNLCSPFILGRHQELDSHLHVDGDDHDADYFENDHGVHPGSQNRERRLQTITRRRRAKYLRSTVNEGDDYNEQHGLSQYHDGVHYAEERPQLLHLASEFFLIPVNLTDETEFEFHLDVDVKVTVPGSYLPLAALEFFLSNNDTATAAAYKFDVANLLNQRSVTYYEYPTIQSVSLAMEIVSYIVVAIAALAQLFFMVSTWHYRSHSVMKLSQWGFLVLLQFAGVFATSCSVLYNPKSDVYCHLQNPMTVIPVQFMLAVVYGRLRRIVKIMSPLMDWGSSNSSSERKRNFKNWKTALMNRTSSISTTGSSMKSSSVGSNSEFSTEESVQPATTTARAAAEPSRIAKLFQKCKQRIPVSNHRRSIRQKYTARQLWVVIILMTLPIIIVEVVGLILFSPQLVVDMNAEESVGRYECGTNREQIYYLASTGVLLITLFAALFEAQKSRRLPGLFNEAASVSFALISSLFVACLGYAVVIVSGDPASSPDAPYIMEIIVVVFITTSVCVGLTYPKLQLIWKGENVVVSKMLREHRASNETKSTIGSTNSAVVVSGLSTSSVRRASDSTCDEQSTIEHHEESKVEEASTDVPPAAAVTTDKPDAIKRPSLRSSEERRPSRVTFSESTIVENPSEEEQKHPEARRSRAILVRENEAPPDRLAMRVMSHSNKMTCVNERILSGLCVDRAQWEGIHHSVKELDNLLDRVAYC